MIDAPTCENCSSRIVTKHRQEMNPKSPEKRDLCHICHSCHA